MANTKIVIKRSSGTATPTTLASGELAYSYSSNNAFIGSPTGDGALPIGGYNTYTAVNNATTANTASTIVKRDANGAFSGQLYGNSNTATALQTSRNFSISGGDIAASVQGFDGTGAVVLNASLNTVAGLSAGYYGGTTAVPVVQVSANGRIMSISNTTIATSFTVTGNTGSGSQAGGGTLTVQGSNGLSTTVSGTGGNETIVITPDSTFVRTTGNQGINGDLSITGNLVINGTTTTVNTATVTTTDSLIKLAANNTVGDVVDIGYYGSYNSSGVKYAGLIREGSGGANAGNFYLFRDLATDPTGNVVNYAGLTKGTLYADLAGATGLPVSSGISGLGTGVATFLATPTSSNLLAAVVSGNTGTGNLVFASSPTLTTPVIGAATGTSLNVSNGLVSTSTWGGTFLDGIVVDYTTGMGRISVGGADGISLYANTETTRTKLATFNANTAITDAIWQGAAVGVTYGGTGQSTLPIGQIVLGNGTGAVQALANVSTSVTGTLGATNTITSFTTDAWGRVTAYTGAAIAIAASQITSGTLPVARGGTNQTSFTSGQRVVFDGTSLSSQANTGTATLTGTLGAANTITSFTTNAYGDVTALTAGAISILGSQVTSAVGSATNLAGGLANQLPYQTGAGATSFLAAPGAADVAGSLQILTATAAGVPVWTTTLDGGTF